MIFLLLSIAGAMVLSTYACIVVGSQAEEEWDRQRTPPAIKDDPANHHVNL